MMKTLLVAFALSVVAVAAIDFGSLMTPPHEIPGGSHDHKPPHYRNATRSPAHVVFDSFLRAVMHKNVTAAAALLSDAPPGDDGAFQALVSAAGCNDMNKTTFLGFVEKYIVGPTDVLAVTQNFHIVSDRIGAFVVQDTGLMYPIPPATDDTAFFFPNVLIMIRTNKEGTKLDRYYETLPRYPNATSGKMLTAIDALIEADRTMNKTAFAAKLAPDFKYFDFPQGLIYPQFEANKTQLMEQLAYQWSLRLQSFTFTAVKYESNCDLAVYDFTQLERRKSGGQRTITRSIGFFQFTANQTAVHKWFHWYWNKMSHHNSSEFSV